MDSLRDAAADMQDKDYPTIYTVNKGTQTVKKEVIFEKEISYKGTDHQDFFDGLRAMGGIVQEGNVLLVKPTLKNHFSQILDELVKNYKELKQGKAGKGGSRRRPSRKYKKSKRVLRRKSRSTRRR
jgi:hypothetical protein